MLIILSSCAGNDTHENYGDVFKCLSLNPGEEYIFYEIVKPGEDHEIWAFNPKDKKTVLVPEEISEVLWTAYPGSKWLFTDKNLLNSLETNTCKTHLLYEFDPKYKFITPIWLNKDQLLINAFEDYPTTTDLYLLNLQSNKAEKLSAGKFVQAVSTDGSEWIQTDGIDLEVVTPGGQAIKILKDFDVASKISPGAIQFLPGTRDYVFIGSRKGDRDYKIWKSSLDKGQPQIIYERSTGLSFAYYQLSPDGKYLGFVEQTPDGYSLIFLNLKTNQVDWEWPYPFTITNPEFRWSPDSSSIAIPYEGIKYEPTIPFFKGIQVMDVKSGKLEILMEEKFDWLTGWYSGK